VLFDYQHFLHRATQYARTTYIFCSNTSYALSFACNDQKLLSSKLTSVQLVELLSYFWTAYQPLCLSQARPLTYGRRPDNAIVGGLLCSRG